MFAGIRCAVRLSALAAVCLLTASPALAAPLLAVGMDAGSDVLVNSKVNVYRDADFDGVFETPLHSFGPFGSAFTGGVTVAVGDVNGDSMAELIVGTGPGVPSNVRALTVGSLNPVFDFLPFGASGPGVFVGAADLNKDGRADIITGSGPGVPATVKTFSGFDLDVLHNFLPYGPGFTGGVSVAAASLNGDGHADLVTGAGPGGQPLVRAFDSVDMEVLHNFLAYDPSFAGGVNVAGGDVNHDGVEDLITGPGAGGGPHVRVFSGVDGSPIRSFFAFDTAFLGGVRVASADVNRDGFGDVIVGMGPGGGLVRIYDGETLDLLDSFYPFGEDHLAGVHVAAYIPEPASLGLLATGVLVLRRRTNRR